MEAIQSQRLLLRRPQLDDAQELFETVTSDASVARFVGWPRHTDSNTTRQVLVRADHYWEDHGVGPFVIVDGERRSIVGTTGLSLTGTKTVSTGYVLAQAAWGKGFASEALGEMIRLATQLDMRELTAHVHPQNLKSIRVLDKLDFKLNATHQTEHFPNLEGGTTCTVHDYVFSLCAPRAGAWRPVGLL